MPGPEPVDESLAASGAVRARTALVLSGGGARGAYQAGVLQGLLESGLLPEDGFELLVGSSAGAINAAFLAAHASELPSSIARLEDLWSTIEPERVFRTDLRSLGGIGMRWVRDLSFGGMLRRTGAKSLLDTTPLRELLLAAIPFDRIDDNIEGGRLRALAVPATDLYTSDGVVFLDAQPDVPLWERGRWRVERTRIGVEHLMSSSAIPIFFPSIEIEGRHFGDGSIRNTAPLSPAINLGADRIVAIGVRQPTPATDPTRHSKPPSIAQVAATLLDAVMLDAIGTDVEHSGRVNTSVIAAPGEGPDQAFRWINVLWLSPTCHFSEIAREFSHRIPPIVRYLMRGLGTDEETTELASYLLFDSEFCGRLVELGRRDVTARAEGIRAFFADSSPPPAAAAVARNGP
ncbi:MAG: patatin-like phospholipase family protein [Myxococcota bacterium]